jgi:hypothetical protein
MTGAVACGHCKRRLSNEYYFTCLECGASTCYIHLSNHRPQTCESRKRVGGRRFLVAEEVPPLPR